jgi:hypothetical protein
MICAKEKLYDDALLAANDASMQTILSNNEGIIYTFCLMCVKWIPSSDRPHTKRWCSLFQECKMETLPKDHMVRIMLRKKDQV